jgi:hypothetical protein
MLFRLKIARVTRVPAVTWLAWLLPVFAWAPLAYPGYFEFNDGFAPIFNLNDLAHHLGDPTWAPVVGQAYDLLRGERTLPYLIALVPRALGVPSVPAVKLVFGIAILAGALGTFAWARRHLGPWPALLASFVYALWPFGLATIYIRGALAETLLLALMPIALWSAVAAIDGGGWGSVVALALSLAAVCWTQSGLAFWFAAILLAYLLLLGGLRRPAFWGWFLGLAAGLLGLLPLIVARGLGGGAWPAFAKTFVLPHQLLQAASAASAPSAANMPVYQLGLVAGTLALFGLVLRGRGGEPLPGEDAVRGAQSIEVWFAGATVLVMVCLSTAVSAPLWNGLPFLARSLTYPWQLLLLAGPWLAWLAGLGARTLFTLLPAENRPASTIPMFSALLGLALLGSYGTLNPPSTPAVVPDVPVAVFGDHEIALLTVQTHGLPEASDVVSATVSWQALRPLDRDYTVFFQAIGPDGQVWGQQDTMPQANQLPTTQWQAGQVVTDHYHVALRPGAPSGHYRALLGFYNYQTGERLRTTTDDKLVLDR